MCSVSPRETQRPRGLYRHAPVPGRQVRQGADFECVECARLGDVSLVPTRTAQPVDMLPTSPALAGALISASTSPRTTRASSSASAFVR